MIQHPEDEQWMAVAIREAERGVGKTSPNPPVGAVIVREGILLGKGWHRAAGRPHAEREAIADALTRHGGDALRHSTLYVTLEPCSTHGRTPPCTSGIIDAGISRVVYACRDENPAHQGRADALLGDAGIEVTSGVLHDEAMRLLLPFFKVRRTGLPWVVWKTAMSLDGRLTRSPAESQWLTNEASRRDVQRLRSTVDAILTSGETVRKDHPSLTIRIPELLEGRTQPLRVVFSDSPDSLPGNAPLFHPPDRAIIMPRSGLAGSLRQIASTHGVLSAMLEAGGVLSSAFFSEGLVDEVVVYLAPLLTGGTTPALNDPAFPQPIRLSCIEFERMADTQDLRLTARVDPNE